MLSWASLWQRVTRLEQDFKNDNRTKEYWHMDYMRELDNIAQEIQRDTDGYPVTKGWANTWLSNDPRYLIYGIQSLKIALERDRQ